MNKLRQILNWTPEFILLAETIHYWIYSSPLNPIPIILIAILISVLIFKDKIFGFIISILFIVLNLYMCLALLSELHEFSSWPDNTKLMLLVGGTITVTGLIASIAMLIKWDRRGLHVPSGLPT